MCFWKCRSNEDAEEWLKMSIPPLVPAAKQLFPEAVADKSPERARLKADDVAVIDVGAPPPIECCRHSFPASLLPEPSREILNS